MFITCCVLGYMFAKRTQCIVDDKPIKATLYTFFNCAISCFLTFEVIHNPWLILPLSLGHSLGTFVAMKLHVYKN